MQINQHSIDYNTADSVYFVVPACGDHI